MDSFPVRSNSDKLDITNCDIQFSYFNPERLGRAVRQRAHYSPQNVILSEALV